MRTTKVNVKKAMGLLEERFAELKKEQSKKDEIYFDNCREIIGMLSVLLWMGAITYEEFDFVLRAYRA